MLFRSAGRLLGPFALMVLAAAPAPAPGQEGAADGKEARAEDRAAIRAAMQSFVKAFEAGDAQALAGHFTEEGELVREGEGSVRGREALSKGFAAFFAKTPKVQAEVQTDSVRFLSRDTAVEEGHVTVRTSPSDPSIRSPYSAFFVREGGRWRLARLFEGPGEATDALSDLGWLVGDWKSKSGEAADVLTTYSWDESKKFLRVRFTIQGKLGTFSGFQVLGKDPATGEIRAWTFESEGGIGEAVWTRDGEHWVAESKGTLADGRTLTATNILRRVDDDTFTWQSIERRLGDEELPDLPPTKVTRVKAAK